MLLREHGSAKFGRLIDKNIEQARYLTELVRVGPNLTLMAPAVLNIVCFRYDPGGLDEAAARPEQRNHAAPPGGRNCRPV